MFVVRRKGGGSRPRRHPKPISRPPSTLSPYKSLFCPVRTTYRPLSSEHRKSFWQPSKLNRFYSFTVFIFFFPLFWFWSIYPYPCLSSHSCAFSSRSIFHPCLCFIRVSFLHLLCRKGFVQNAFSVSFVVGSSADTQQWTSATTASATANRRTAATSCSWRSPQLRRSAFRCPSVRLFKFHTFSIFLFYFYSLLTIQINEIHRFLFSHD